MIFILAAGFLLRRYCTEAVPLPSFPPVSSAFHAPIFAREDPSATKDGNRAVLDIIWSCHATTFACTWVSVHPNVPFRNEGYWTILGRRIYLMFFSILAPEFMVVWAFKQWRGARMIREIVNAAIIQASPNKEVPVHKLWTTAHGHFLQMGGFRLCATARENFYWGGSIDIGPRYDYPTVVEGENDHCTYNPTVRGRLDFPDSDYWTEKHRDLRRTYCSHYPIRGVQFYRREVRTELGVAHSDVYKSSDEQSDELLWEGVLKMDTLKCLLQEKLVRLPTISKEEIDDRSKGDALSKGIALLQLTWFVIQNIARAAQGLAISELELTTAALAGLNSVMYVFWWSKPHDTRFPMVIQTKGAEALLAKRRVDDVDWSFSNEKFDIRKHLLEAIRNTIQAVRSFLIAFRIGAILRIAAEGLKSVRRHIKFACLSIAMFFKSSNGNRVDSGDFMMAKGHWEGGEKTDNNHITVPEDVHEPTRAVGELDDVHTKMTSETDSKSDHSANMPKDFTISALQLAALPIFSLIYLVDLLLFIPIGQILGDEDDGTLSDLLNSGLDSEPRCETFRMMFYSEQSRVKPLLSTSSIAGALFGAVHCLAWHFSFPSHAERILCRSASLGVVWSCISILTGVIILSTIMHDDFNLPGILSTVLRKVLLGSLSVLSVVYPVARITLLILAVTSLRSLPRSTFDTIDWIELFPHI